MDKGMKWDEIHENGMVEFGFGFEKKINQNDLLFGTLTTSIICISVSPKLNCNGSDSLTTGRSKTL